MTYWDIEILKYWNIKIYRAICNCNGGVGTCPEAGQCLKTNVVYKTCVTTEDGNSEYYTGLTAQTFKARHYGHKTSFNNQKYKNKSALTFGN